VAVSERLGEEGRWEIELEERTRTEREASICLVKRKVQIPLGVVKQKDLLDGVNFRKVWKKEGESAVVEQGGIRKLVTALPASDCEKVRQVQEKKRKEKNAKVRVGLGQGMGSPAFTRGGRI
jgi:hypothetical protein